MRTLRRTFRLSLAVVLLPGFALAQARPPSEDMIPRELALALLNFGPGTSGAAAIRVGRLPDDIPIELVPPGLEVLGSTIQFDNSVIVLASPQQPDSAIARLEAHLLASDWTKPPVPQYRAPRGFVAADFSPGVYLQPDMACKGDTFVTYSAAYRRSGGSVVRLAYNRGQRYSACRQQEQRLAVTRNPYEESPIPTLRAPMGTVTKQGSGMSSSGAGGMTLSTRLGTRLKPAEVVAHYDKQLREQGWTPGAQGTVPFFAARAYTKTDEKSQTWNALLVSMVFADSTDQDVSLRIDRR